MNKQSKTSVKPKVCSLKGPKTDKFLNRLVKNKHRKDKLFVSGMKEEQDYRLSRHYKDNKSCKYTNKFDNLGEMDESLKYTNPKTDTR